MMTFGIWAWGIISALLSAIVVAIILIGRPTAVYTRIKDAATAIGAVVAASALAWSLFFQTGGQQEQTKKLDELIQKVDALSDTMNKR